MNVKSSRYVHAWTYETHPRHVKHLIGTSTCGTIGRCGPALYIFHTEGMLLSFSWTRSPYKYFYLPQVSNFVIGLYFLSVVTKFGISKVYLGFASVCLLAVLYISGNVVETKGRSLEEIERELNPAVWGYQLQCQRQCVCRFLVSEFWSEGASLFWVCLM